MNTPQRNNDVYNHPQNEEEMNQGVDLNNKEEVNKSGDMALNPNPRANENVPLADNAPNENKTNQAGSEITDGEAG